MKNNKINNNERKVVDATSIKKIVSGAIITGAIITGTGGVFADATDSKYDMDYKGVGYIGVAEEVGPNGNGGFISTGEGDAGGISYGIMQLTSKGGGASANKFVFEYLKNNHPEFYAFFKDAGKAGTDSFSSAWTKAYNYNPGEFEEIQMKYKEDVYVAQAVKKVKEATGIDLLSTRAKTEWVYSTSVQFGPDGTLEMIKSAGVTKDMDDEEFIKRVSDARRNSVGVTKFLGCDASNRRSVYKRFTREEKELLKIALEEKGLSLEELLNGEVEEGVTIDDLSEALEGYGDARYVMGGKNSEKLDCSGFVSLVFNDLGLDVDTLNTNAANYRSNTTDISRDELQPGDLVFWHDKTGTKHAKVYHIGIYKGNDTVVDCSIDSNGVGTRKLSSLQDDEKTTYSFGRMEQMHKLLSPINPMEDKEVLGDNIEVDEEIKEYVEENFDRDASVSVDEKDGDNLDTDPENDDKSNDEDESIVENVEDENEVIVDIENIEDESIVDMDNLEDESNIDIEDIENEDESIVDMENENESIIGDDSMENENEPAIDIENEDESIVDTEDSVENEDESIIDIENEDESIVDTEGSTDKDVVEPENELKDNENEGDNKNDDLSEGENDTTLDNPDENLDNDSNINNEQSDLDKESEITIEFQSDLEDSDNNKQNDLDENNGDNTETLNNIDVLNNEGSDEQINATTVSNLSESEMRIQELEAKLQDNLFYNLLNRK